MYNDFEKYSISSGISTNTLDSYSRAMLEPVILEERKTHCAPMSIFSRLLADRIIFVGTPIDDDVANIIQAQLLYLSSLDDKSDITMYLNTPGGVVSSGLGIYDTMQLIKPDVATLCTGLAASMGSVLLCAGAKGKRSILPHAKVMIHQPLGGTRGQASDILIEAKEIEKCREELIGIIADHSGQPFDKVFADADRNFWMTSNEALDYGMVDKVLARSEK